MRAVFKKKKKTKGKRSGPDKGLACFLMQAVLENTLHLRHTQKFFLRMFNFFKLVFVMQCF